MESLEKLADVLQEYRRFEDHATYTLSTLNRIQLKGLAENLLRLSAQSQWLGEQVTRQAILSPS